MHVVVNAGIFLLISSSDWKTLYDTSKGCTVSPVHKGVLGKNITESGRTWILQGTSDQP